MKVAIIMGSKSDYPVVSKAETILKEFGVAVFPREGHDLTEIKQDLLKEDPAYMIQILDAEMVDISSTQIRNAIAEGDDISKYLM